MSRIDETCSGSAKVHTPPASPCCTKAPDLQHRHNPSLNLQASWLPPQEYWSDHWGSVQWFLLVYLPLSFIWDSIEWVLRVENEGFWGICIGVSDHKACQDLCARMFPTDMMGFSVCPAYLPAWLLQTGPPSNLESPGSVHLQAHSTNPLLWERNNLLAKTWLSPVRSFL